MLCVVGLVNIYVVFCWSGKYICCVLLVWLIYMLCVVGLVNIYICCVLLVWLINRRNRGILKYAAAGSGTGHVCNNNT